MSMDTRRIYAGDVEKQTASNCGWWLWSLPAIYYDDPSSNPAEVCGFYS